MIEGNKDSSKWIQVGEDLKNLTRRFVTSSQIYSSTNPNYYYKLKVRGTFGTKAGTTAMYMDPAYVNTNIANPIGTDATVLNNNCTEVTWKLMGACPPTPNFPVGYASNHIYEYYIGTWNGSYKYEFTDDGDYSNNTGLLTFELWENQGTEAICEGSSTTLTSNLNGNITWYKGNSILPTTGQTITVNEAGVYTAKSTVGGIVSVASNPITILVNPLPTITLGTVPAITSNNRSFDIPFSSPTDDPSRFSVSAINMNGFQTISDKQMGDSSLTVNIPFGQIGSYNFNINVKNTTTACISNNYSATVQINLAPPEGLTYLSPITLILNQPLNTLTPNYVGLIDEFKVSKGSLPIGLQLDSLTGEIWGTPKIITTSPHTVEIIGKNSQGETSFQLIFNYYIPAPFNLNFTDNSFVFIQNTPITPISPITSPSGINFKMAIGSILPLGLSINPISGKISGTPYIPSTKRTYTIKAFSQADSTEFPINITVLIAPPKNLSYPTPVIYEEEVRITPLIPRVIGKVDSYSIDKALPEGLSLNPFTGIISGTPTKSNPITEYWITATNSTGDTRAQLFITVLISRPQITYPKKNADTQLNPEYTGVDLFISGQTNPPLIPVTKGVISSISINKPLPTGLVFDPLTGIISGTPTVLSPPTTYVVTITNSTASTTDTIRMAAVVPRPSSLSYATPQTYIEKIKISPLNPSVQGSPTLFTVDKPLPAGLTLNPTTGIITGTPTKAQDFTDYVITATNSTGYDTFTIAIKVLIAFPEIKYPVPGVFRQGVPVNFKPTLIGIADVFKIDSLLPAGLSFDTKTGLIAGTPTWPAKPRTYIITATNSTGPGRDSTTITVLEDVNYDTDKDGYTDIVEIGGDRNNPVDTDKDGLPDYNDLDSDGDEIKDEWENDLNYGGLPDCDHDGVDNRIDPDACDPVAFQGISPNGDGKNDYLVIPGVMRTTPNTLTVLDRGGNIVYEMRDYANNWGGDTNRGNPLLAGDGLLPDGVYFYILDYNGVRPTVSTYIYINRLKK
jgi:gliding motility-associated-like protein